MSTSFNPITMIIKTDTAKEFYTEERCFIKEILNAQSSENISLAQARVQPGVTTALHVLDADELYYILKGNGTAEVNSKASSVEPGDLVIIRKGEEQRITNTGETDLVFLCICQPRFTPERYTSLE